MLSLVIRLFIFCFDPCFRVLGTDVCFAPFVKCCGCGVVVTGRVIDSEKGVAAEAGLLVLSPNYATA